MLKAKQKNEIALLSAKDPDPVMWVNADSDSTVLLLCEHAGNAIPASHNQLGLSDGQLNSHIGVDIGAAALARKLAHLLQAPLILQPYSRLLIDCNRPPGTVDSIPVSSDGVTIPANLSINEHEIQARQREIFEPLDHAIDAGLHKFRRTAAFSIHSFTPQLYDQKLRPWHAGFLTRTDQRTAQSLIDQLMLQDPYLILALNEPYTIDDGSDWFIPRYAESLELMHCLIEIRNDQLLDEVGINRWAGLLASALNSLMGNQYEAYT